MRYRIDLPPRVRKLLDSLDAKTFAQIDKAVWPLRDDPRPRGCKKLDGNINRIRTGDWRVIYAVFDRRNLVQIIRIVRRSERTYRRLP